MVRITESLIRSRSDHNDGIIYNLEEISLHQFEIEKIEFINQNCKKLKIIYLQNNIISKIENINKLYNLNYINLALNNIKIIENLNDNEELNKLDLTVNFIDIDNFELSINNLKSNVKLRELYLTGNPCTKYIYYRSYIIYHLPQLVSLDGEEITHTERIEAKQNKPLFNETLKEAIEELLENKNTDINTDQSYTPENRLKMYREVAEEKAEKEASKRSQHDNLIKDSIPDPIKEAHKKMSEKAVELEDGTLPRQRNQGQWEFNMNEDDVCNLIFTNLILEGKYCCTN